MFFFFLPVLALPANARTFDDIFPGLNPVHRTGAFSENGIVRSVKPGGTLELSPSASSGIDLASGVMANNNLFLTESLLVVPYGENRWNILDAYNALGKVQNLKGRLYNSHTRNTEIPLFEEATRLDNPRRGSPIPDPPPAFSVPSQETVYIRLKDVNFGNSYYQADISSSRNGILFSLTNFRNITYLLFPVMREGKFNASLYMEPIEEGMLIYSIAGTEVSDFVAGRIDMPSAISKRLAVFTGWITDGLNGQP